MEKLNYNTATLVIDMVYDFVNPEGAVFYEQNLEILPKINKFVKKARENNSLIIYIQHSHRKDKYDPKTLVGRKNCLEGTGGDELDPSLVVLDQDYVLKKRRYSAFAYTDLDLILREHGINRVYVTGTKTNNCVRSTVESGYHLGYEMVVIEDLVATDDKVVNDIYLHDINRYYGKVVKSDEVFV